MTKKKMTKKLAPKETVHLPKDYLQ
jgi:hypothetical protein